MGSGLEKAVKVSRQSAVSSRKSGDRRKAENRVKEHGTGDTPADSRFRGNDRHNAGFIYTVPNS